MCARSAQERIEHGDRDDEIRGAERDPELLREPLVQHVPRRQAELRLEEADDPAGAEEEPDHEPGEPRGEAAVEERDAPACLGTLAALHASRRSAERG